MTTSRQQDDEMTLRQKLERAGIETRQALAARLSERAHNHPQPFGFSEIERRGPDQSDFGVADRRTPQPDRGSRQPGLEAVRYLALTLQDIIAAIQTDWPTDRPQTQKVQDVLSFGAFAITRVRKSPLRRMAEGAQS